MIKVKKRKILLLPGDGVGPEVVAEVKKVIQYFNSKKSLDFEVDEDLVGGASYEKHKNPKSNNAQGACSLDEPHPKFFPVNKIDDLL